MGLSLPPELTEYLRRRCERHGAAPVQAPITPGDIRVCEGGGVRCFVLILTPTNHQHTFVNGRGDELIEPSCDWVTVSSLTNELELASDTTPVLEPEMTGLPFRLLVMNLTASVFPPQLSTARHGQLTPEMFPIIKRMIYNPDSPGFWEHPEIRRGMSLRGPADWRWDEHIRQLTEVLHPLCCQAMAAMMADLDGDPHPGDCPCSICQPHPTPPPTTPGNATATTSELQWSG